MNSFGTDGIRTRAGTGLLQPNELIQLGSSLAQWALNKNYVTIFIAQDTRLSSSLFNSCISTGLLQHPITIEHLGILPTPLLEHTIAQHKDSIGIMITASHNQYHDNGVKVIQHGSGKLTEQDEQQITQLLTQPCNIDYEKLGTIKHTFNVLESYKTTLNSFFKKDFLHGLTIALDCANGAFSNYAPKLLEQFGATVHTINTTPDGKNINANCGALHPEKLQKTVLQHKANIGIAFDGDGDRLRLISKDGRILDGDDTLALLLQHPSYKNSKKIVGTIMTNQGFVQYLTQKNKQLIRTPVGDKYVSQALQKEQLLLGGEPSGHTILNDYSHGSDGLFSALRALQGVIDSDNWKLSTFEKFPQVTLNLPVKKKEDLRKEPYARIIKEIEEKLHAGRVIVRYSGTEPLLRIMVEDDDAAHAHTLGTFLSEQLAQYL